MPCDTCDDDDNTEALLLVDAKNAFIVLNRKAALHNISYTLPCYGDHTPEYLWGKSDLYVGGEILASYEGTTQGDPLAMSMYTVDIMPLIHELQPTGTKQVVE